MFISNHLNFVVKIPNFLVQHSHFLQGCYANWSERNFCKTFGDPACEFTNNYFEYVAPSLFCSWFGLIQIQKKCTEKKEDLTEEEKEKYRPLCWGDNKKENFGWLNGKLVCLDYV